MVAVDDETGIFCYLVVEAAGGLVGFVGVPVDVGGAGFFGLLVYALNQGSSCSFSTGCFGGEQILQVTSRPDGDGAAMEKVMC